MKEIPTKPPIDTVVKIPGSKSISHRALITASLAQGRSQIGNFLACDDTLYTLQALQDLGAGMEIHGDHVTVSGTGGRFPSSPGIRQLFLGNSGTSYRLLLSIVALAGGDFLLTGHPRMHRRPIGNLVKALNELGVEATCLGQDDLPPVFIRAKGLRGGKVEISGAQSSQFVSSLLLAAPCAEGDMEVEVKGELVSGPYVDITIDVMEKFGVSLIREGYHYFRIPGGQGYRPCPFTIEGDVSNASYFWAAAAVTGGSVTTENLHPRTTRQGDIFLLDILEEMGCLVEREAERVTVHGRPLSGIDVDMRAIPDVVPSVAAMALFAEGTTVIRHVSHLRHKESDRLKAIASEWTKLGGRVNETDDGLMIHGGGRLSGVVVDPHDDHRIAMSLAVVGLRVPGIRLKDEGCVQKSFPGFWDIWDTL